MKLAYLASPYSHDLPETRAKRYKEAISAAAWMINRGWMCYSPIAHSVAIGEAGGFTVGFHFWRMFDFRLIEASDYVVVLCIDGWRTSVGLNEEIKYATAQHKPIMYLLKEQGARYHLGSMPY